MMKRVLGLTAVLVIALTTAGLAGWTDNDFDNLTYDLAYTDLEGTFHFAFTMDEFDIDQTFVFPLEPDAAGDAVLNWVDQLCDPDSEYYNPQLCAFAERLFTDEVIAGINAQWNRILGMITGLLPETMHTHQMPFPMLTVGGIKFDDLAWEWPCAWNPVTGDFTPIPFYNVPIYQGTYGDISWIVDITAAFSGTVHRDQGYALDGSFEAGAGFNAGNDRFDLCTSLEITGAFAGQQ